jgi:hypothetical protein
VESVDQRIRRLGRIGVDQQLAEVRRRRFRIVIVVEARSAAARERGDRPNTGLLANCIRQALQSFVRAGEPSAGWHPQIDDELIALVHREEAIRHG